MSGVRTLLRAFLRRDRWQLLWWGLGAAFLYVSQAAGVDGLYATQAEFDRAATAMGENAAFVAMAGPARALNTVGGQVTWQATAFGAIVAGLMSMFLVGRHTRAEEDSGRDELLRASAVDRTAPMTAGLLTVLVANAWLGVLVTGSLVGYGLAVPDSVALGVGITLCGWVFAAVALLAAQVTSSSRAAYAVTGAVIGAAYLLRAIGDVSAPVLSWLSPIGWYQAMHPFSGLRWWPALLLVLAAAGLVVGAYGVFGRRDFGAGVMATRAGVARGSLGSGLSLSWRLQRGAVVGWALGLLITGASYGSMGGDVGDLIGDSEASRDMFAAGGGSLVDGFYASAMVMLGLLSAGFAVSSALRARGEEEDGRVEQLLAAALPRDRWLLGHVAVTVLGTLVVLGAGGLGLAAAHAATAGEGAAMGTYLVGTVQQAAPVLVLAGTAWLLHGLWPRGAMLAWLGLAGCVVVMLFGPLLRFPQWVLDLSPFTHLATVPVEDASALPVVVLVAIAVALTALGRAGLVRRDLR